jgi:hypothetical protein
MSSVERENIARITEYNLRRLTDLFQSCAVRVQPITVGNDIPDTSAPEMSELQ